MNLRRARRRRQRLRKRRDRQYAKWERTKKDRHLKRFRRFKAEVKKLNHEIAMELKRRDRQAVIPREDWDAAPPNGSYTRQPSNMTAGVQHHSAIETLPANASREQEESRVRAIQKAHLAQGWTDIGYHLVIFPSGRTYEGRPQHAVGAHTLGHNTGYAGWCLDGNYEVSKPTKAALAACHRARKILGVADKPVYGHDDLNPTSCPGKNLKPHVGKEI